NDGQIGRRRKRREWPGPNCAARARPGIRLCYWIEPRTRKKPVLLLTAPVKEWFDVVPRVDQAGSERLALASTVKGGKPPFQLRVTELPVRVRSVMAGSGEMPLLPAL